MEATTVVLGFLTAVFVTVCVLSLARRVTRRHPRERDPLTGLRTHVALLAELRAARTPRSALLYLDLDRFDLANERLGRLGGDRVMATAAALMCARAGLGLLVRMSGDEFALLIPDADQDQAVVIAERLRRAVSDVRLSERGHDIDLTVSIGVALLDLTVPPEEALRRASAACRAAKARGRNRVEVYRPALSEEAEQLADARWAMVLRDAIRQGRISLVYQPIIDPSTNRVALYEVLARMDAEDGTQIEAGQFIPAAERCGLIREIDRIVFMSTLYRMELEQSQGNQMRCAINLSGLSFHDDTMIEFIKEEIRASHVDPRCITFEVTETAAIANLTQARHAIETLRAIGCRFALDDFGTGLSSLAYLRYLPVDLLKIDGAFVHDLANDHVNRAMVHSINELAHALGLATIAEGVEDEPSLRALEETGVDFAQGYYVGRPADMVRPAIVIPGTPPVRTLSCEPDAIRLPARTPHELMEFLDFLDTLDMQARTLRDVGVVPGEALTRPDAFDGIAFDLIAAMRAQVADALRRGSLSVSLRLPVTDGLAALARWAEPRMDLLAGLTTAGLVQENWQRPLTIMIEMLQAVLDELGAQQPA